MSDLTPLLWYKRHDGILKQACGGVVNLIAVCCEYVVRLLDYRGLMGDPFFSMDGNVGMLELTPAFASV